MPEIATINNCHLAQCVLEKVMECLVHGLHVAGVFQFKSSNIFSKTQQMIFGGEECGSSTSDFSILLIRLRRQTTSLISADSATCSESVMDKSNCRLQFCVSCHLHDTMMAVAECSAHQSER